MKQSEGKIMICKICGNENPDNVAVCSVCGNSLMAEQYSQPAQAEPTYAPPVQNTAPPTYMPPVQNNVPPIYTPPVVSSAPPMSYGYDPTMEPVTVGWWALVFILSAIPCVNIVMLFVWAFGSNTKQSLKNFARASLIFMGIGIVLGLLLGITGVFSSIWYDRYYW